MQLSEQVRIHVIHLIHTALLVLIPGNDFAYSLKFNLQRNLFQIIYTTVNYQINLLSSLSYRRDSYTYDKWVNKLNSSGWLSHVKDILTCGCLIAQCIERVCDALRYDQNHIERVDITLETDTEENNLLYLKLG